MSMSAPKAAFSCCWCKTPNRMNAIYMCVCVCMYAPISSKIHRRTMRTRTPVYRLDVYRPWCPVVALPPTPTAFHPRSCERRGKHPALRMPWPGSKGWWQPEICNKGVALQLLPARSLPLRQQHMEDRLAGHKCTNNV